MDEQIIKEIQRHPVSLGEESESENRNQNKNACFPIKMAGRHGRRPHYNHHRVTIIFWIHIFLNFSLRIHSWMTKEQRCFLQFIISRRFMKEIFPKCWNPLPRRFMKENLPKPWNPSPGVHEGKSSQNLEIPSPGVSWRKIFPKSWIPLSRHFRKGISQQVIFSTFQDYFALVSGRKFPKKPDVSLFRNILL